MELTLHNIERSGASRSTKALAHRAKTEATYRAYVVGVRAWCNWCDKHALPCLPGRAADIATFLAVEHKQGLTLSTLGLRRAAIRDLHAAAGCSEPTADPQVSRTLADIRQNAANRLGVVANDKETELNSSGRYPNCLTACMKTAGITDRVLAPLAGTSQQTIYKLRVEHRKLTVQWAQRLAPHLGVEWYQLVDAAPPDRDHTRTTLLAAFDVMSDQQRQELLTIAERLVHRQPN